VYKCVKIVCVSKGRGGVFLSISMHLLQIVSIYLFIFPRREKNVRECVCVCSSGFLVYSKKLILSLDSKLR